MCVHGCALVRPCTHARVYVWTCVGAGSVYRKIYKYTEFEWENTTFIVDHSSTPDVKAGKDEALLQRIVSWAWTVECKCDEPMCGLSIALMHAGDGCNLGEVTICNATRSCTRMNATGCRGSSVKSTVQIDARGAKSRPDNPYICLLHVDWRTDAPTIELKEVNEARRTMEMKIELEDSPFTDPSKSRCAVGNVQPNIGCPSCRVQEYSLGGSECIACSAAMECDFKGTFSYSELHQIKHCIKSCLTCINGAASEGAPITAGTCGHTRGVRWAYATGKLGFSVLAALGYWNAGYACTCIFAPRALAHTHTRACVRAHTRAGTHAHMHPHLHTHARMHTRKHASTHARTHA